MRKAGMIGHKLSKARAINIFVEVTDRVDEAAVTAAPKDVNDAVRLVSMFKVKGHEDLGVNDFAEALLRAAWEIELRAGGGGGGKKKDNQPPQLQKLLFDAVDKYLIPNLKAIKGIAQMGKR